MKKTKKHTGIKSAPKKTASKKVKAKKQAVLRETSENIFEIEASAFTKQTLHELSTLVGTYGMMGKDNSLFLDINSDEMSGSKNQVISDLYHTALSNGIDWIWIHE